ncbi:MAG TPA: hypothetical protein VIA98_11085 [Allosphingosinicella sp.]
MCVLNSRDPFTACRRIKLSGTDAAIAAAFEKAGLDAQLIQFNVEGYDQFARSDEHHAEHHFYANVGFERRQNRRVAVFKVPRVFLDWGYQNLRRPAPDPLLAADFPDGQSDPDYVAHCATNYLVKNFWHNFVHAEIQGINQGNYGRFRGLAREDSDFQADHVANLLTLRSYGVDLLYRGMGSDQRTNRVNAIFIRNRCNQVFAMRARHRRADAEAASDDDRWSELEWRFCRGVANRVSIALLAHHLAVPSLRIFLGGEANQSTQRGTRWRHGNVLAEVAGRRMATPHPAYVPDDEWRAFSSGAVISRERQGDIRRKRAEREDEVATWIRGEYRQIVSTSEALRESIGGELEALGARIGVTLV